MTMDPLRRGPAPFDNSALLQSAVSAGFRTVMDASGLAAIGLDASGSFFYVSPGAALLFGYPPGEPEGKQIVASIMSSFDTRTGQTLNACGRFWADWLCLRTRTGAMANIGVNAWELGAGRKGPDGLLGVMHRLPAAPLDYGGAERRSNPYGLSQKEFALLTLMAEGLGNKQIARAFDESVWTVNRNVSVLLKKLGTSTRIHACIKGLKMGLIF